MEVVITATTGKGESSTEKEVNKTFREVLKIAQNVGGSIVYGRGFQDGTEIVVQK